jgi:peptidoglycan/LPS O-acetylase OafA/YrhL
VSLFFMITAYLFVGKLLDRRDQPIDWTRLCVSRVLRLTPLYLIAVLCVVAMCGALTDWALRTTPTELARALLHWLFFTIGGAPDINGIEKTNLMTSGVTWSLPLEWMFYLLLPTLALLIRRDTRWWMAAASFLAAWAIWSQHKDPWMLRAFAIGGLSAWLSQKAFVMRLARDRIGSVCVAAALAVALLAAHQVREWRPMLALAIAFTLIAAGNTLFGVLVSRASRSLGDLAYGVYLLHGLMLFGSVQFVIGPEQAAALTVAQHWAWLMALTPLLVALAWLAFHGVEHPCMGMTNEVTRKVTNRVGRLRRLAQRQR